eukprot:CAMPEP_0117526268 /NCGR_PEP_ID=MMETSP0784-20121206/36197_1 /TAXON_ID=39447 /ORGANISM="" /LENGTH=431 /DNA_ID=CAMNT_0005322489 /DNA_START=60 /DNA_END=1355 /DNA_ORIENTATION=-
MENLGRPVKELLDAQRSEVVALQTALEADLGTPLPPPLQSDTRLLRHVLSVGSAEDAVPLCKMAVAFYADPKNARVLECVAKGVPPPQHEEIVRNCLAHVWGLNGECGMRSGAPVYVIRTGFGSPKELMDEVCHDDFLEWLVYNRLVAMKSIDALTEESGNLVKMVTVNDFRGVSLLASRERRLFKALGDLSTMAEYLCPQAVMRTVMINTPSFMSLLFRAVKPILPKKALDKIAICPADTLRDDISTCPFMREYWESSCCPYVLGGTAKVPRSHPMFLEEAAPIEGFSEFDVKPETSMILDIAIPAARDGQPDASDVEWSVLCQPHGWALGQPGVRVSAWLIPMESLTPNVVAAMEASMKADDEDEMPEPELETLQMLQNNAACVPSDGKCLSTWKGLKGPAVVAVAVHNPSRLRTKTFRYALRIGGIDE